MTARLWRQHALVFFLYLGCSLGLLLPPNGFDLTHHVISYLDPDVAAFIWYLTWWPFAITHGTNPLVTHFIWAPSGINMGWITGIPGIALIMAPVTMSFGPIVAYNIVALLSPVLSACACYLLCYYVTKKIPPAIFGGLIYGFSSYEFRQLMDHMNLYVTFVPPLLVLVYISFLQEKLTRSGFLISATALLVLQFTIFIECFATLIAFGLAIGILARQLESDPAARSRHTQAIRLSLIAVLLSTAILSPLLIDMFSGGFQSGKLYSQESYSVDLANLFIPTQTTWIGGNQLSWLVVQFPSMSDAEAGAYLGLGLIFILILFIRRYGLTRRGKILTLSGAGLLLAALGPQLFITGQKLPVPLPWLILGRLPLLDKALPDRIMCFVTLVAALMSAFWLSESPMRRMGKISLALLALLMLVPNVSGKFWAAEFPTPPFFSQGIYQQYLRPQETVLILPVSNSMFWQAQSGFYFRMAEAWTGYTPTGITPADFADAQVMDLFIFKNLQIGPDYPRQLRRFISDHQIGAVVVAGSENPRLAGLLAPLGIRPIATGGVNLYLISQKLSPQTMPEQTLPAQATTVSATASAGF
jgi:hypothetical protein